MSAGVFFLSPSSSSALISSVRVSTGVDCVVRTSLPALLLFADDTACELTTAADDVTATELVVVAPLEAAAAGVDVDGADVAAAVDVTLLLLL